MTTERPRIQIRRAQIGDLPSILRIETKSFARDAWDRALFLDYFRRSERSIFLVARIQGKIVSGKIVGYALAFHSRMRAEIHSLAVAPEHRGKGVAMALLKSLLARLRRRGFGTVSLDVRPENKAAIQLYRKAGFQRIRRVNGYYEDGGPSWRMRKSE